MSVRQTFLPAKMYITLQVYAGAHGSITFRAVFSNREDNTVNIQHRQTPGLEIPLTQLRAAEGESK